MSNKPEALALLERIRPTPAFEALKDRDRSVRSLAAGVDQTNTSWVIDDAMIVKKYRHVAPGEHPEVRAGLALLGIDAVPPLLGWVEGDGAVEAVIHRYVRNALDGWDWVRIDVERLLDGVTTVDAATDSAARLGAITRQIHERFAVHGVTRPNRVDRTSWFTDGQDVLSRALDATADRPEGRVLERWAPRLWVTMAASDTVDAGSVHAIHGDLHLGQILRDANGGYAVIDFEGQPDRPLAERLRWQSPVWDVATMVRSYANAAPMVARRRAADAAILRDYVTIAGERFLEAYGSVDAALLRAFEVAKACHELVYAAAYLPRWFDVAWQSLEALATDVGATG